MYRSCALLALLCLSPLVSVGAGSVEFAAAVALYTQHKPAEAQQAFEALAAAEPQNADIPFYLGRLALQRDDADKAVTYLERAVSLNGADARFHLRLGDAYGRAAQKASLFSQLGLAKKCKAAYEKAVELDPRNIDAHTSLMGFYQQAPGFAGGGLDKALGQAREIKKLDAARGRLAVAGVYVADKKFTEAFAEYDEALEQQPGNYTALYQLGRLAALSGQQLGRGLAALRACLTQAAPENQPPHAAVHWRIGNILERQGDKAGARAAYEAALKADPKFAQAAESLKRL